MLETVNKYATDNKSDLQTSKSRDRYYIIRVLIYNNSGTYIPVKYPYPHTTKQ